MSIKPNFRLVAYKAHVSDLLKAVVYRNSLSFSGSLCAEEVFLFCKKPLY